MYRSNTPNLRHFASLLPLIMSCHTSASIGSLYPTSQVNKTFIPDDKLSWSVEFSEYSPPYFESPRLKNKPWADPSIGDKEFKWNAIDGNINRESFEGQYIINDGGYPLNPIGRIGIKGRGLLGRWGPNHAADPIVTRWKRDHAENIIDHNVSKMPILQLIVIQRRDNKKWALPGGFVDDGEKSLDAAIREFMEETMNIKNKSKEEVNILQNSLQDLFSNAVKIHTGYVGDYRNTDNAWIETTAYNFHDNSGSIINKIVLQAADDAENVKWLDMDKDIVLHATHKYFVNKVAALRKAHW